MPYLEDTYGIDKLVRKGPIKMRASLWKRARELQYAFFA
jgi:hypothetical protein